MLTNSRRKTKSIKPNKKKSYKIPVNEQTLNYKMNNKIPMNKVSLGIPDHVVNYNLIVNALKYITDIPKNKNTELNSFNSQFEFLKQILESPSPIGLEGGMSYNILEPFIKEVIPSSWKIHKFKSNSGIVVEKPSNNSKLSVMMICHADKIRMQVRSIECNGKIYINCDSFVPSTLLGQKIFIISKKKDADNEYIKIPGVVQGLGAIHYISKNYVDGTKCVQDTDLFVDLGITNKIDVERLGITCGDPIIFDNPIRKTFGNETFCGAYLDNGVGCFTITKLIEKISNNEDFFKNITIYFAIATYEEIGRYGSRVIANKFSPDILIGVDACHDYKRAAGVVDKRYPPIEIGKGPVLTHGSVMSPYINNIFKKISCTRRVRNGPNNSYGIIKIQEDTVTDDTGNDGMAGFLSSIDAAASSIGIPVANMHTVAESASYIDLRDSVHLLHEFLIYVNENDIDIVKNHKFKIYELKPI